MARPHQPTNRSSPQPPAPRSLRQHARGRGGSPPASEGRVTRGWAACQGGSTRSDKTRTGDLNNMNEGSPKRPVDEPAPDQEAAGEALRMSDLTPTSSPTSTPTPSPSPSTLSETGSPSSQTPPEPGGKPPSSSTSTPTANESYSPRVDKERVLRWQLQLKTTAPPDQDDRIELSLIKELNLRYGERARIVRLRTKE